MPDEPAKRTLTTIFYADVADYSRLTGVDEEGTHRRVMNVLDRVSAQITASGGTVLRYAGDAILATFPSVVQAVDTSVEIQVERADDNAALEQQDRLHIRIGINLGDVIEDRGEVFGDGVNLAARLEAAAVPGGICLSSMVWDQCQGKVSGSFVDSGKQTFKNIDRPIGTYNWSPDSNETAPSLPIDNLPKMDKTSIAVLPFDNMSGDPEQEYFSDGISEDITTELSRFRTLHVVARNSSFSFKGEAFRTEEIGAKLGAHYVVEGSVRKSGDRVRVTSQLIETSSGSHLWAERYDRSLEDIFAVQDEVTQAIVAMLPGRIEESRREGSMRKSSKEFSAYDYFLKGRWLHDRSMGRDSSAIDELAKSIDMDPTFAQPHAVLARLYAYNVFSLGAWYENQEDRALTHIDLALEYGENDPAVHVDLGEAYMCLGKFERARKHFELSLQLNPSDMSIVMGYGFFLAYAGDAAAGIKWIEKAFLLAPFLALENWEVKAETLYLLREYEDSLHTFEEPENPPPHTFSHMAACYAQLGQMEEAEKAVARFREVCGEDVNFPRYAANHARMCKRQEDADNWMEGYRKAGLLE